MNRERSGRSLANELACRARGQVRAEIAVATFVAASSARRNRERRRVTPSGCGGEVASGVSARTQNAMGPWRQGRTARQARVRRRRLARRKRWARRATRRVERGWRGRGRPLRPAVVRPGWRAERWVERPEPRSRAIAILLAATSCAALLAGDSERLLRRRRTMRHLEEAPSPARPSRWPFVHSSAGAPPPSSLPQPVPPNVSARAKWASRCGGRCSWGRARARARRRRPCARH